MIVMKTLFFIVVVVALMCIALNSAYAESQTASTELGTLDVRLTYDEIIPNQNTTIKAEFLNPVTDSVQVHIDYTFVITRDGEQVFGPTSRIHTSPGVITIPIMFQNSGVHSVDFTVDGILFQPIPPEAVSFDIVVSEQTLDKTVIPEINDTATTGDDENGGCLVATAAYGSELAPQVQQLRELRDNTILATASGTAFMSGFNQFYYMFSPTIADLERENPVFRETVQITLMPMLSSLSLLNYAEIDTEAEMLGYGVSVLLLNVGMYVGIPAFAILKCTKLVRARLVEKPQNR